MPSRRAAWALVALLLLVAPAGAKTACSDATPCIVAVEAAPGSIVASPDHVEGFGPYVLEVHNAGAVALNVSFGGLRIAVGPGATNRSIPFGFPQDADYPIAVAMSEDAGGATTALRVARPPEPSPSDEWSQSAKLMSVILPCLVGVALIAIAVLVLRNGSVHRHNLIFAAYYLLSGLKSFSEGIDGVADRFHDDAPLFPPSGYWALQGAFCALAMLPTLLLFLASFPRPLEALARRPALGFVVFLPSIAIAVLLVMALAGRLPAETYAVAEQAFNVYGTLLTILVLVHILRATRSSEAIERTQARYVAAGFAPAFAVGWLITLVSILPDYGVLARDAAQADVDGLIHFVSPLLELLSAGAVAFAILRYNILGVSPRFRLGVKSFLVGFIFVVVFLLTQFVENVVLQGQLFNFAGPYGSFMLSGITGIVLFKPIEAVSNRAANRLVPKEDTDDQGRRSAEVYRAQCTYVLRDANVTDREMEFLRNLRTQLGLNEAQARAIEESVERMLKVDAPQTGASAGTAQSFVAAAAAEVDSSPVVVRRAEHAPSGPVTGRVIAPAGPTPPAKPARRAPAAGKRTAGPAAGKPKPRPSAAAKPNGGSAKPNGGSAKPGKKGPTARGAPAKRR